MSVLGHHDQRVPKRRPQGRNRGGGGGRVSALSGARSTRYRVGVDIGKMSDPTAIVITEQERREGVAHFVVRHIEPLPLGTSYPAIAIRVVDVVGTLKALSATRTAAGAPGFSVELIVDGTGVGLPVVDLLREQRLRPTVAIFSGSEKLTIHPDDAITIGKAWMVSRLQMLLQTNRLHIPDVDEGHALVKELQDYDISISDAGHTSFNARSGRHDDLVIALGLSVGYEAPQKPAGIVATGVARGHPNGPW